MSLNEFATRKGRQGPKNRMHKLQQSMVNHEHHNSPKELEDRESVLCVTDPERGRSRTVVEYDARGKGFEHVCLLIGAGVSDSVMPKDQCKDTPIKENAKSKSGYECEVAGCDAIKNDGGRGLVLTTQQGQFSAMNFQAAEATNALGSVAESANARNNVALQTRDSYIEYSDGRRTRSRRERGIR